MTDMRRHLPTVLSCLRRHLTIADNDIPAMREKVKAALEDLLPASYGIGTGCVVDAHERQSLPVDLLIYDKTITSARSVHDAGMYELRRVLLVIMLANEVNAVGLAEALRIIASVKMLRGGPQSLQNQRENHARTSQKKLFPLGIVGFHAYRDEQEHTQESLSVALDTALKREVEGLRPDYLIAQVQQLSYVNPLLAGDTFEPHTINIVREPDLVKPRFCYVCKKPFVRQHFFYMHFCPACGDHSYQKRRLSADLSGRIALVTGARIKIGYATALRLLRAGACVIGVTRFPHDAALRYSREPDFADWHHRLQLYGVDLRHLASVEQFIAHLTSTFPALDILVNNAAQTVRRPRTFYASLLPFERASFPELPPAVQALVAQSHAVLPLTPLALAEEDGAVLSLPPHLAQGIQTGDALPGEPGSEKAGSQWVDIPFEKNSWIRRVDEIDLTEMLEVQVVNVTVPFLLISRLRALLERSAFPQRFVVNVSAAEGRFAQLKLGTHPHTNMAKAALNMLTRTAAADLAQTGIFMNSVDPGWVSHQGPFADIHVAEEQPHLPLDMVDAAARVCDPIFTGVLSGQPSSGQFYKDYLPADW